MTRRVVTATRASHALTNRSKSLLKVNDYDEFSALEWHSVSRLARPKKNEMQPEEAA